MAKRQRDDGDSNSEDDGGARKRGKTNAGEATNLNIKKRMLMKNQAEVAEPMEVDASATPSMADAWQSWDDEGYGDVADRQYLNSLNEFQREELLMERQEFRTGRLQYQQNKQRFAAAEAESEADASSDGAARRSTRSKVRAPKVSAKEKAAQAALDALEVARDKRTAAVFDSEDESEYSGAADMAADYKTKGKGKDAPPRGRASAAAAASTAELEGLDELPDDDPLRAPIEIRDVRSALLQRAIVESWHFEPFFEAALVGTFIRVGLGSANSGNTYRLGRVVAVNTRESHYEFNGHKTWRTLTYLGVRGVVETKLNFLSNKDVEQSEFDAWAAAVVASGASLPTKFELRAKRRALNYFSEYVKTTAETDAMIAARKAAALVERLDALDILQLKEDRRTALIEGDMETHDRLDAKIRGWEAAAVAAPLTVEGSTSALVLETNRRIRIENELRTINAREKAVVPGEKADPYARKETEPTIMWRVGSKKEAADAAAAAAAAEAAAAAATRAKAVEEAKRAAEAEARRLTPAMRLRRAHDFDLALSIELAGAPPTTLNLRAPIAAGAAKKRR